MKFRLYWVMVLLFFSFFNFLVIIWNWILLNIVGIIFSLDGFFEELKFSEWMEFICVCNGRSGFFIMVNCDDDSIVIIVFYDG